MRTLRLTAVLAFLLVTAPLMPVAAQVAPANTFPGFGDFAGIKHAISRAYGPVGTSALDEPASNVAVQQAAILEFATVADAMVAFAVFEDLGLRLFAGVLERDADVSIRELDEPGDEAHRYRIAPLAGGFFEFIVAREGAFVFVSLCAASTIPATALATGFIEYLVNDGEVSSAREVFDSGGNSRGGLWDMYPAHDHVMLEGLVPTQDSLIYPAP